MSETIKEIFEQQQAFYKSGATMPVKFRKEQLIKLKNLIKSNELAILNALQKDLGKSHFETYATEIGEVYEEINIQIKNINKWSKPEKVRSPISQFPAKSYIYKEPYGVILIIGPFNYPFHLVILPLIDAISAGNCAMIKSSHNVPETAAVIHNLINNNFDKKYICSVAPTGGREAVKELFENKFDYAFFTGSVPTGSIIMGYAAKKLIPVTLELGGKSPCIVDNDCNIELSAKRIVWGKLLNGGQTCVAPDYLLVHKDIKEKFLKQLVLEIKAQFGEDIKNNKDFTRIVNSRTTESLKEYFKDGKIYYGGHYDIENRFIEPTILTDVDVNSPVMTEEIFGPILPVLEFDNINDVLKFISDRPKPLAIYYFSKSNEKIKYILKNTTSGGVSINDVIVHAGSTYLPFGGVGDSGIGSYHGKYGFETFTHKKGVMKRAPWFELPVKFAPYKDKISILRKLMK